MADEPTPGSSERQVRETLSQIESRHKAEVRKLEGEVRALLKTAKKSNRAEIEAKAIQMQYDLKGKHSTELDEFEEMGGAGADGELDKLPQN
jgi:hypothetical protein